MDNNFGLEAKDLQTIIDVIIGVVEVDEAIIFGSRAKGTFREGSDIDLAVKGTQLSHQVISQISNSLNEETTMPYQFDVVNYHTINNVELSEHIDRVGKSVYKKQGTTV